MGTGGAGSGGSNACSPTPVTSTCQNVISDTTSSACNVCWAQKCCAQVTACSTDSSCKDPLTGPAATAFLECNAACCAAACAATGDQGGSSSGGAGAAGGHSGGGGGAAGTGGGGHTSDGGIGGTGGSSSSLNDGGAGGVASDAGTSCTATSGSCSTNGACCNFAQEKGMCVDFGSGGRCADFCTANSGCNSGCCTSATDGHKVCGPASACQVLKGTGDGCTLGSQCTSGTCGTAGWCTAACSPSDSVCAGGHGTSGYQNEFGQLNWCMLTNANTYACFPGCTTTADCAPYPGTTCMTGTEASSMALSVGGCSKYRMEDLACLLVTRWPALRRRRAWAPQCRIRTGTPAVFRACRLSCGPNRPAPIDLWRQARTRPNRPLAPSSSYQARRG